MEVKPREQSCKWRGEESMGCRDVGEEGTEKYSLGLCCGNDATAWAEGSRRHEGVEMILL